MRLFVAIDVGDDLKAEVARVRTTIEAELQSLKMSPPRITWVAPAGLHLTLRFLGEVEEPALAGLKERLAGAVSIAPFEVRWHGLGTFPSPRHPRALWVGLADGLSAVGALEAEVSRRLGQGEVGGEQFRPHVTIGRVRTSSAGVDWPGILARAAVRSTTTEVRAVGLYQSVLSAQGPRYTTLMKLPLTGSQAHAG